MGSILYFFVKFTNLNIFLPSMFNFSEFEDTVHCRMVFPEQEEQVFAKGQVLSFQAAWFQETFPGGRCMFLGEFYTDSLSSGIFRK